MGTRTRSRDRDKASGGKIYIDNASKTTILPATALTVTDHETCTDTTMSKPYDTDHPLTLARYKVKPLVVKGTGVYGYAGANLGKPVIADSYIPPNRTAYSYCPTVYSVSSAYYLTKALAGLDPQKPVVDVPLFLFELRELPSMIRDLGRVLNREVRPQDVPGGHLAYSFGWAPLLSDTQKMFNFAHQTWQRSRYLRQLEAGTRVRRHLERGALLSSVTTQNALQIGNIGPASDPYILKADVKVERRLWVWFTANAYLLDPIPQDNASLRRLAFRYAYGGTARWSTIWNALPWTWLSDYFNNIGDYVAATNGMSRFKCTRLNIMKLIVSSSTLENVRVKSGFSVEPNSYLETIQKERTAYTNPTPRLAFSPFLSLGQRTILGALSTASALRAYSRASR